MVEKVRVLVVDDSAFFRKRIRGYLEEGGEIAVIGEAGNGEQAAQLARELKPDLVTMDVAMPVLDGIQAVRRIMRDSPTRIIMFSALTREGARATLEALDAGAVDFVSKHAGGNGGAGDTGRELRARILSLVRGGRSAVIKTRVRHEPAAARSDAPRVRRARAPDVVVIGASTGGPVAVQAVLAQLPPGFPYPLVVAVHMPEAFTPTFAARLDEQCRIRVREAGDGDLLAPGLALVAPGGRQIGFAQGGAQHAVAVRDGGAELYKPSVDILFASAARTFGSRVLAVVLTGMGADGTAGARELKTAGARIWSQDEASCVVYGMPQSVARAGLSDRVLPLAEVGRALREVG